MAETTAPAADRADDRGQPDSRGEVYGLLAEFKDPHELMHACAGVRDQGFRQWDAHTPFPIHGLDRAMGLRRSRVSVFVLVMGLTGALLGMLMQWWVASQAYPLVISGKPFDWLSWPAFVPIMFECGVLGGATGALLGFLLLAKLPRHHHSLFNSETFTKVTDDGFFISIEASDPRFDAAGTAELLQDLGARHIEPVAA